MSDTKGGGRCAVCAGQTRILSAEPEFPGMMKEQCDDCHGWWPLDSAKQTLGQDDPKGAGRVDAELRKLIGGWRRLAEQKDAHGKTCWNQDGDWHEGEAEAYRACADELEELFMRVGLGPEETEA